MRGDRNITFWIDWTTFEPRPDFDYREEPDHANAIDVERERRLAILERDLPRGEVLCKEDARNRAIASAQAKACKAKSFPESAKRREIIARLLAERGPLRTAEIVRETGIRDDQVYAAQQHPWFRREGRARAMRIALTEEGLRAVRSERAAS